MTNYGKFSKLHRGLYDALPNRACTLGKLVMSIWSLGRISTTPVEMLLESSTMTLRTPVLKILFDQGTEFDQNEA
jgi:hypothetical protein